MEDKKYIITVNGLHVLNNKGNPTKYTKEEAEEQKKVMEKMFEGKLKIEIEMEQ